GIAPGSRLIHDEFLYGMNALRRSSVVDSNQVERHFWTSPVAQRLDDDSTIPVLDAHPGGAVADAQSGADHLPSSFRIVEGMTGFGRMTDEPAIRRIAKPPAVQVACHAVAKADQLVVG